MLIFYGIISPWKQELFNSIDIDIKVSDGVNERCYSVPISLENITTTSDLTLSYLAISSRIRYLFINLQTNSIFKFYFRDLELDENNKDEVIKLATKYGLVSKYTSFVAIEERSEPISDSMNRVDIDISK